MPSGASFSSRKSCVTATSPSTTALSGVDPSPGPAVHRIQIAAVRPTSNDSLGIVDVPRGAGCSTTTLLRLNAYSTRSGGMSREHYVIPHHDHLRCAPVTCLTQGPLNSF